MNNIFSKTPLLLLFFICCFGKTQAVEPAKNNYFDLVKNIEIYTSLYKELNTYYVDNIDPNTLMKNGIDKMLEGLDPFTTYMAGADVEDFEIQTTGKYAGIGARIGRDNDGNIMITDPYEGNPAQKAGLEAGDIILEIDGKPIKKYESEDVSQYLKGEPGTKLTLKIKKVISNEERIVTFERAEIRINNVSYFGMINNNIGYIKLDMFTPNAANEVQNAVVELKKNTNLKGIIIDLRGNGGGMLEEAINICNLFVNKGTLIVSTKGKTQVSNEENLTRFNPIDINIPLAFLTDEGTASASEIVAGSMQDLDRGIVIGQNTYGKGLVQITKPLPYKTKLKLTISKYYIPSGRCVQRIDYTHRNADGTASALPDSLRKEFKTKAGRIVKDGAGIEPDIKTEADKYAMITIQLFIKNYIFDYANLYKNKNKTLRDGNKFIMNNNEYNQFVEFMKGKECDYKTESEQKLDELKKSIKEEKFSEAINTFIKDLDEKIKHDKEKDLIKFEPEIKKFLQQEIISRYTYEKGKIENSLIGDKEVDKAVEILSDNNKYKTILTAQK